MSSESVRRVASSWVEVSSFHTRFVVRFMNFTALVRNILDKPSHCFSIIIIINPLLALLVTAVFVLSIVIICF
jgi:hypothetical protein